MHILQVGQRVALASMPHCIFIVSAVNVDCTYCIETQLADQQKLSYDNVSIEMLKILPPQL